MMRMKQNMLKNKIENNFKKEVDKMKNEIINEMNLKSDFENGDKMTNNLTNEMEERKMTRLGLYESRTFGRISYGFIRDEKGMVYINEDEAEIIKMIYSKAV